jgi:mannosyltransferase OCH1-like enzyme
MIPKIIWQTYETPFKDLLPETKDCVDTWKEKNPTWKYMYMDSQERDDFVLHEFDQEWYELFTTCSLGIVKANIWRCMILYIYGGVYSDLDTICNESI